MTPFQLLDAHSVDEAVALLRQHRPQAQAIASGGDLLGLWKEGLATPAVLVNLATAPELSRITRQHDGVQLGAMLTLARIRQEADLPSMLAAAIDHIASPQLRARTTLGGNLLQRPRCLYFRHPDVDCFKKGGSACPAPAGPAEAYPGALFPGVCHAGHPSDLAPVLIALEAQAQIAGPHGSRLQSLASLYLGAATRPGSEAQLAADEVLTAVVIPQRAAMTTAAQAFEKIAPRAANEFSTACAAVVIEAVDQCIGNARIVLGGVAPGPWICEQATALLVGATACEVDVASIACRLIPDDQRTDATRYRAKAARRAIECALVRALRGL